MLLIKFRDDCFVFIMGVYFPYFQIFNINAEMIT